MLHGGDKAEREVHEPHTTNDSREMPSHKQVALEQDAMDISVPNYLMRLA